MKSVVVTFSHDAMHAKTITKQTCVMYPHDFLPCVTLALQLFLFHTCYRLLFILGCNRESYEASRVGNLEETIRRSGACQPSWRYLDPEACVATRPRQMERKTQWFLDYIQLLLPFIPRTNDNPIFLGQVYLLFHKKKHLISDRKLSAA